MTSSRESRGGHLLSQARAIARRLIENGHETYIVGGTVRDLLLGRPFAEVDLTTSAQPETVRGLFSRTVPLGEAFGVVAVVQGGLAFEVATFRREEGYSDGRHPDGVEPGTLLHDLQRRDFTINGLVMHPETFLVHDYVGGLADLSARVVRAIGDPEQRMQEDYLRTLRAVRFAGTLDFSLDAGTFQATRKAAPGLDRISRERIHAELSKLLAQGGAPRGVRLLGSTGLFPLVFPFLPLDTVDVERVARFLKGVSSPVDLPLLLAMLVLLSRGLEALVVRDTEDAGGDCEEPARSLRLSTRDREALCELLSRVPSLARAFELRPARRYEMYRSPRFSQALSIFSLLLMDEDVRKTVDPSLVARLEQEASSMTPTQASPPTWVDGRDLLGLGVEPGPKLGALLAEVSDRIVEGSIGSRLQALEWVRNHLGTAVSEAPDDEPSDP